MYYSQLLRRGPGIDSAAPAVVTDAIATPVGHVIVVNVVNNSGVYIRHRAVVVDRTVVPIGAIITMAGITKAVVNPSVEANVGTPISCMTNVHAVLITPPRRRP